jgi:hypothetical protein
MIRAVTCCFRQQRGMVSADVDSLIFQPLARIVTDPADLMAQDHVLVLEHQGPDLGRAFPGSRSPSEPRAVYRRHAQVHALAVFRGRRAPALARGMHPETSYRG